MRRVMEFYNGNDDKDMLDGLRVFNTFRVGSKWANTRPGELLDVYVNDVFKVTTVVAQVEVGTLSEMLQLHCGVNYTRNFGKTDMATMAGSLWTELQDIYGILMRNTPVTVIYLINPMAL